MTDVNFSRLLLRLGGIEDTRTSFESRRTRVSFILKDLRIDVRLFIGKRHGEIEEQKFRSVVELGIFSHFLMYLKIFFSKNEAWDKTCVNT